jgi:cobalt-precorrin 5A hydrolase
MGKAMIVAGIGCRKGVAATAVIDAIDAALAEYRRERGELSRLATGAAKRDETAIVIAAGMLGVPLHYVGDEALAEVAPLLSTHSERSAEATGSPSLSEASALAAAGENGALLGPRIVAGPVTCALAEMELLP